MTNVANNSQSEYPNYIRASEAVDPSPSSQLNRAKYSALILSFTKKLANMQYKYIHTKYDVSTFVFSALFALLVSSASPHFSFKVTGRVR